MHGKSHPSSFSQLIFSLDAMLAVSFESDGGLSIDDRKAMRLQRFLMKVEKMPAPCQPFWPSRTMMLSCSS